MTKPFVLIIEDDPQLGKIFSLTLQTRFDTEICTDGIAAMARLDQVVPDLVVLDLHLPGASGDEVLAYIHLNQSLANTPIILATADHALAETLNDQVQIVLLKPISPSQLLDLAIRVCPLVS
ncbi:MAG: response regulator [Chloroflexota bacterium]|nr:MAG: response regulator [Chloroflexota bacterium]